LANNNDNGNSIEFLNNHLIFNTFCNGYNITVSDVLAFGLVIDGVRKLDDDLKHKYSNVVRWVNHIQSLDGIKEQIRKLKLRANLPYEGLFLEQAPIQVDKNKKQSNENKDKKEKKEAKPISTENKEVNKTETNSKYKFN
jgi:hypothetical protein